MENSLFQNVYNPDVLSCIANLSNDEVFTPPELAVKVIDMLPQRLFENPDTTFLDPCCKSGVFLREIAKRLIKGLEGQIPDLEKRLEHIFSRQLFGIAITELTSLLSRRSVYCSKYPSSEWSAYRFPDDRPQGNIIYQRIGHSWKDGKCIWCGASQSEYDRGPELESHAYQFIHNLDVKKVFNMHFDVIIGNPPYQLNVGKLQDSYAIPIYDKFVLTAKQLKPSFLCMIIPSRWFAGGRGLDEFRDDMLSDKRLKEIHDYPNASDCFPGVEVKGGVCYFLWKKQYNGDCEIFTYADGNLVSRLKRPLLERGCSTLIRYNEAIPILRKVQRKQEKSFADLVSPQTPFGIISSFKDYKSRPFANSIKIYVTKGIGYTSIDNIVKNIELSNAHKIYITKSYGAGEGFPHQILNKPFIGDYTSCCSQTYLVIGPFKNQTETNNALNYIKTRFFRFMVMLKKNTQDAMRGVYQFVPLQDFSSRSDIDWKGTPDDIDRQLYAKYGLDDEEIEFIESMIRPME